MKTKTIAFTAILILMFTISLSAQSRKTPDSYTFISGKGMLPVHIAEAVRIYLHYSDTCCAKVIHGYSNVDYSYTGGVCTYVDLYYTDANEKRISKSVIIINVWKVDE